MGIYHKKDFLPEFSGGHCIITWAAFQCQPEWCRKVWMSEAYEIAAEYSAYGDTYFGNRKELGQYVELDDGTVPYSAIGVLRERKHYDFMLDYWESPFYEPVEKALRGYLGKITAALMRGDLNFAARVMGAVAHYIEDCGVPSHAADNGDLEVVRDYFDSKFDLFSFHGYTEQSPPLFLINEYEPRCYGQSPEEAATAFISRFVELVLHARALLFPMAQTVRDDDRMGIDKLRLSAARKCAEVLADYLYTVTCIGLGRFENGQDNELSLAKCWPYRMTAWAPYPYYEQAPMRLVGMNLYADEHRMVRSCPCELLVESDGKLEKRRFDDALGAGSYFEYHYRIPAGIYSRFTAIAGIHADLGAKLPVQLTVVADGKEVFEQSVEPGEPAIIIDAKINGCSDLKLISSIGGYKTDVESMQRGSNNHVVWGNPQLVK